MPNNSVTRRVDVGSAWPLEVDGIERFLVQTACCANPACPCTQMTVLVAPRDAPDDLLRIDYDTRTHSFGTPRAEGGFPDRAISGVIAAIDAQYREALAERWARSRGRDAPGRVPDGWEVGTLASYLEIYPLDWDVVVTHEGQHYLLDDSYCIAPGCECTALGVAFTELTSGRDCGSAQASLPELRLERTEEEPTDLLRALVARLDKAVIRKRFRRARAFAESRATAPAAKAPEASPDGAQAYQLRLHLLDTSPPVWRRIEVRGDQTLADVTRGIAAALGWATHPVPSVSCLVADARAYDKTMRPRPDLRATLASLTDTRFEWRFGSPGWTCEVTVERQRAAEVEGRYPRVVDGECAAPPARCAGPSAFALQLDAFHDAGHPDHEVAIAELGETFDELVWPAGGQLPVFDAPGDVPATGEDIAGVLAASGSLLMWRTEEQVLALEGAREALLAIVQRPREAKDPITWSDVHAVRLLGRLEDEGAVAPLLERFAATPSDSLLKFEIAGALEAIGEPALEPLLVAHAAERDVMSRSVLRRALAGLDVEDERVAELLREALARDEPAAATDLATYGDPDALAPLAVALRRELQRGPRMDVDLALVIVEAIEDLGGDVSSEDRQAIEARAARVAAPAPSGRRRDVGRNDPCWCGSGKKYKKCHLEEDERRA